MLHVQQSARKDGNISRLNIVRREGWPVAVMKHAEIEGDVQLRECARRTILGGSESRNYTREVFNYTIIAV